MRKADIVSAIAEKTGIAKVDVLQTLENFFSEVRDTMGKGENVYIRGFGSFVIKKRAAKTGRNIKRNKTVQIPEHFVPAFKPAKIFTDHVKTSVTSLPDEDGGED
jgi:DNA-binding protein HU-beta